MRCSNSFSDARPKNRRNCLHRKELEKVFGIGAAEQEFRPPQKLYCGPKEHVCLWSAVTSHFTGFVVGRSKPAVVTIESHLDMRHFPPDFLPGCFNPA